MSDITSIQGQTVISVSTLIKLLDKIIPSKLGPTSTLYDIGYEAAKEEVAEILGQALGKDFTTPLATRIAREFRRST